MKHDRARDDVRAPWILAFACSVLLFGYESLRSPSNALFVARYGVERLPWAMLGTPLFSLPILWCYNKLLSCYGPRRTLVATSILSSLGIFGSYLAIAGGSHLFCLILYWLREIYILILVEQMWSIVNSLWSQEQGKRYNGRILGVSTLGSVLGGLIVQQLATVVGVTSLLLVGVLSCLMFALLAHLTLRRLDDRLADHGGASQDLDSRPPTRDRELSGVRLIGSHPTLRFVLTIVLLSQVYSTFITLQFQTYLGSQDLDPERQAQVSGFVYAVMNGIAFFVQLGLTARLMRRFSVAYLHALIPLVHLISLVALTLFPALPTAALSLVLFKCLDYSLFRASKETLYVPFSFDVRFRTKEFIDVTAYRMGKVLGSFLILAFNYLYLAQSPIWCGAAALGLWLASTWYWARSLAGNQAPSTVGEDATSYDAFQTQPAPS